MAKEGKKKISKQGKKKISKPRKTPSLKQKLQRESKIVKINELAWTPVEIPDNLGDYEGFLD